MINWIRRLFCNHEWEDVSGEIKVWMNEWDKYPIAYKRTYICKKCLKKKTIRY